MTASNFVTFYTDATNFPCIFIIDTGADISIFKPTKTNKNLSYDANNQSVLQGITSQEITSLGSVNIKLSVNNFILEQSFQLVDNFFPIPTDGILGRDFLSYFKCIIDHDSWLLSMNLNNNVISVPIQNHANGSIILPARSEVIRQIINFNLNDDVLIESSQVLPGVFCSNTIVTKHLPFVRLVNTNDENIILNNFNPNIRSLENYFIFNISTNNTPDRR